MGRGFEPLRGHKRGEVLALHRAFFSLYTSSINTVVRRVRCGYYE